MWNLTDTLVTNNSFIMEITLIASFNPKYKYLRIRSVGAGFNPANGAPMDNISTTMTTIVSDFNIYNNGAGVTADWDFLSMRR